MLRRWAFRWIGVVWNWYKSRNCWPVSEHLKWFWCRWCLKWFWCRWWSCSFWLDTGVETVGIRAGAGCGLGGKRGIGSHALSGLWGVKYGMDSKNVTSRHKVLSSRWAVTPVSFLSSRIPNVIERADNLSKPGDKSWIKHVQPKTRVMKKTLLLE